MTGRRDVFELAMRQGHSAAWDQKWERAIAAYRKALEEFPEEPMTLTSLGLALLQIKQFDEALQMYQRAARLNPNDFVALEKSADILERKGRLEEAARNYLAVAEIHLAHRDVGKAIDNWTRASRLAPNHLGIHSRLALAYERTGRTREAVLEYLTLARILQRTGETKKSLQAASRALQLEPQNATVRQVIQMIREGTALSLPQHPRGVTAPLRMAQVQAFIAPEQASPDGGSQPRDLSRSLMEAARQTALTTLASMLFDEGNNIEEPPPGKASLETLTRGRTLPRQEEQTDRSKIILHLSQAIDLQTRGEGRAAAEDLARAIGAGLDHPAAHFNLGTLLLDDDRPGDAIPHLKQALAHPEYALSGRYALGEAYRRLKSLLKAASHYLEALKLADLTTVSSEQADELAQLYETLAESLPRQTDEAEQRKMVDNLARFLSGDGWEERLRQARAQLDEQMGEGGVTPLAEMLAVSGSGQVVESLALIDQYREQGYRLTAMEEAYRALVFAPTYLPIHLRIAEMLLQNGRQQAAIAKYTAVAETYHVRGNVTRAVRILQDVVRLAPMNLGVRARLIDLLVAQGKTDEALSQYLDMAETYYQLADLDMARTTYATALRLAQRSRLDRAWGVQILHQMGDIDQQRLDWRQALRVYEQIKTLAPNDEKARELLINLNFRMSQARQALAELDDYARSLLAQGRTDQLLSLLEELVRTHPDAHVLPLRLAQVYNKLGRKEEAVARLDALAEIQLDSGQTDQAIQTIKVILAMGPAEAESYRTLLAQLQPAGER